MFITPSFCKLHAVVGAATAVFAFLLVPVAVAQEAPAKSPMASLTQAPPGRVIFDFGNKPKASVVVPASSTAVAADGSPASAKTAAATALSVPSAKQSSSKPSDGLAAPAEESKFNFFGNLPPPSGRPLNDARRLDAPDQGIVIKDAPKSTK